MPLKRRQILAITVTLLLSVSGSPALAQECISDLSGFRIGTKLPDDSGLLHITYQFVDEYGNAAQPTQSVRDAFLAAINDWNSKSGTTRVVFEPAPPGTAGDIQFTPNPNLSDPCAAYSPTTERIYYNPSGFTEAAEARPYYAAGVIAHELGHFLGLYEAGVDPATPTIMNNPVVHPGDRCKDLFVPTIYVQGNDASRVNSCVAQARQQHTVTPTYDYYEYNYAYSPSCYNYYQVTDYYLCYRDSCSYWFSTYSYLGSTCMLTQ